MSYTKLDNSIVTSTVWREPNHVRLLWITMLALADRHGEVMASIPGLADMARISVEECHDGIRRLMAPDQWSRTKDDEGRRIREIDGGWFIINHAKYRQKYSDIERRELASARMARYREGLKGAASHGATCDAMSTRAGDPVDQALALASTRRAAHASSDIAAQCPLTAESENPKPARKPRTPKADPAPRQPDPVWDAVAALFYGGTVPTGQKSRVGAAVRDLKELGASPSTIREKHGIMTRAYEKPGMATLQALVRNWASFVPPMTASERLAEELDAQYDWTEEKCRAVGVPGYTSNGGSQHGF